MKYTVTVKVELEAERPLMYADGARIEVEGIEAGMRLGEATGLEWKGCRVCIEEERRKDGV